METKIKIKEENSLSDDVSPQNESKCFTKDISMKTNSDAVFLNNDCNRKIKMEIKSETSLLDFDSQNEKKYLQEESLMKVKNYNSDPEVDNKIEIKEAHWWLETETSSVSDEIKNEDFTPATWPRSCIEAVYGNSSKSPLPSAEDLREHMGKDISSQIHSTSLEEQGSYVIEDYAVEKNSHSGQHINCNNGGNSEAKNLTQDKRFAEGKRVHKCQVCDKRFTQLSYLKLHNLIHEGTKPHECEVCQKRFTQLSSLKKHYLIHEGLKPHKCVVCEKQFTELSNLKRHNLIHEGTKPHKCAVCDKRFIQLSDLKKHNLIHEGEKPHKCEICGNRFTLLSSLKKHSLTHVDRKPHKCGICEKRFTRLSYLKKHYPTHEGKKPFKCSICDKRFTQLATLRCHNLIHEGGKPHKCEICKKSFTLSSYLKRHNLVHADEKQHKCVICEKRFTHLSSLKTHNLIHKGKRATQVST